MPDNLINGAFDHIFRNPALWLALGGYIIAGVWWGSGINTEIEQLRQSVVQNSQLSPRLSVVETLQAAQALAASQAINATTQRLDRIETKVDTLIAR